MSGAAGDSRVRAMVDDHFARIWSLLRRLGVPSEALDDAAQQVFIVAARRAVEIEVGRERPYLQGVAVRVASEQRRSAARRDARRPPEDAAPPQPDELLDRKRARELLDDVLDAMPFDLRAAFVLFELDELTVPEIAQLLDVPEGTAASRLRRAREDFRSRVAELKKVIK
ncbi:MAG: sigma-70 family RNA polymerase sigma factor [Labilithrix sp.]|nr:sigma-70 family RNA polymerase sigma factor [Labilithrix sp.]MCW5816229.1 sigma-70 family RNA polymerase sigma factor [Labilithrix sp.]